jgi:transcriptional accessory protein Tex/SPT6
MGGDIKPNFPYQTWDEQFKVEKIVKLENEIRELKDKNKKMLEFLDELSKTDKNVKKFLKDLFKLKESTKLKDCFEEFGKAYTIWKF